MKIVKVEAIPMMAPADQKITMSQASFDTFFTTIVRLTTDDGIVGIGECMVRTAAGPTKHIVDEMLAPLIMGRDPLDVEAIWEDMFRSERHRGHASGMFVEAMSGIDTALWDIIGKYHHMPLGKLLGGYDRKQIPAYASSIMLNDIPQMVERAQELVSLGYRAMKVKIGTDCRRDVETMKQIRMAVGDGIDLMADANSYYRSVRDAVYVGRGLEELSVLWLEEPVMPDNVMGYQQISQTLDIAIAAGESSFTSLDFCTLFQKECIAIAQPDVTRCGGVTESRRIAELATVFNRQYAPHTGLSSSVCIFATLQLAAWAPNFITYEYGLFGNPLQRLTTKPIPPVVNGLLEVPQEEGIGCELDESFIKKYRID